MYCLWCHQEFHLTKEYRNYQEGMAIPIGEPTFAEQQVINGTICLDCYHQRKTLLKKEPEINFNDKTIFIREI